VEQKSQFYHNSLFEFQTQGKNISISYAKTTSLVVNICLIYGL